MQLSTNWTQFSQMVCANKTHCILICLTGYEFITVIDILIRLAVVCAVVVNVISIRLHCSLHSKSHKFSRLYCISINSTAEYSMVFPSTYQIWRSEKPRTQIAIGHIRTKKKSCVKVKAESSTGFVFCDCGRWCRANATVFNIIRRYCSINNEIKLLPPFIKICLIFQKKDKYANFESKAEIEEARKKI